jgi:transcriptional repressor OPI1
VGYIESGHSNHATRDIHRVHQRYRHRGTGSSFCHGFSGSASTLYGREEKCGQYNPSCCRRCRQIRRWLPEPAKEKVKGFILSLPGRWSVAVKEAGLGESWGDAAAEEASSTAEGNSTSRAGPPPSLNPRKRNRLESSSHSVTSESTAVGSVITSSSISAGPSSANLVSSSRPGIVGPPGAKRAQLLPPTAGAARHAASRVLTLAQESLHAVKGVTGVFKDTLDRAEA